MPKLIIFPNGHSILTIELDLTDAQRAIIREELRYWKDNPESSPLVIEGTTVERVETFCVPQVE